MAQALARKERLVPFAAYFKEQAPKMAGILPKHLTPERIYKIAISAMTRSPNLLECSRESIWKCVYDAATLGLEVGLLGSAYLVPFGKECQLIVGYQGLIDLCRRSGHVDLIEARAVHEHDAFDLDYGRPEKPISHKPVIRGERGEFIGVYALARLKDTPYPLVEWMDKAQIDAIRKRSRASGNGPWVTDYEEMARKTVIRRLTKSLPKSVEMAAALAVEDGGTAGAAATLELAADMDLALDAMDENKAPAPTATDRLKRKMRKAVDTARPVDAHIVDYRDDAAATLSWLSSVYDGNEKDVDDALANAGLPAIQDIKADAITPEQYETLRETADLLSDALRQGGDA